MGKHSITPASTAFADFVDCGRSARYIGRVGALAVALGVGMAVTVNPGIAFATPDAGSVNGASDGTDTDRDTPTPDRADPDHEPAAQPSDDDVDPDDEPVDDEPDDEPEDNGPDDDELEDVEPQDEAAEVLPTELPQEPVVTSEPSGQLPDDSQLPTNVDPPRDNASREFVTDPAVFVAEQGPTPDLYIQDEAVPQTSDDVVTAATYDLQPESATFSLNTAPVQPLSAPTAPAPFSFISTVVSALVVPLLAPIGPAAPAQAPVLWAVLAWVRRQFEHTFTNRSPVLVVDQETELIDEDTVAGSVTGFDPDPEDELSYSHSGGDPDAQITVDDDGDWTYTAPADWDGTEAWTDSFQITATDEDSDFHVHGLLGFFNPDRGHSVTETVFVTIPARDANDPPVVEVGEPSAPSADGVVTFTVQVRDPEGDETDVVVTQPAGVNGTITREDESHDAETGITTYTYTYTPALDDRIDAHVTPGPDVIPLTVTVDDGVNTPVSQSISATVDPVVLVATETGSFTRPSNAIDDFNDDSNTYAYATQTGSGTDEDPYVTTVTIVRPGEDPEVSAPIAGTAQDLVVGSDGSVAITTVTDSGTILTAIRPDGALQSTPVAGVAPRPTVGDDGTIVVSVTSGSGTSEDPYETTVTVLRPGVDPAPISPIPGYLHRYSVGADGTVAVTTYPGPGAGGGGGWQDVTLTVLRPGLAAQTVELSDSDALSAPVVGDDGTVAILSAVGAGTAEDPGVTTLTVVRPTGQTTTHEIDGYFSGGSVTVGADGTTAVRTFVETNDAQNPWTITLTVLRPDGAVQSATAYGVRESALEVGDDGTTAQAIDSGSGFSVLVLRPGAAPIQTEPVPADGNVRLTVGEEGTVAYSTYTDPAAPGEPYISTVYVLRPGETEPESHTVEGLPQGSPVVGRDGTVVVVTDDVMFDDSTSLVTVWRPGQTPTSLPIDGQDTALPEFVDDETFVLTARTGGGVGDPITYTVYTFAYVSESVASSL